MNDRIWKGGLTGGLLLLTAAAVLLMRARSGTGGQTVYYNIIETNVQGAAEQTAPQITQSRSAETIHIDTAVTAETTVHSFQTTETPDRNLNTADEAALQRVSGVGVFLAGAIVQYRTEIGGFTRRAQLLEIEGIGETLAARIMAEFDIPDELPPEDPEMPDAPASDDQPPPKEIAPEQPAETEPEAPLYFDANTVTREELLRLPDMTEACADAILAARARLGRFRSLYEILVADTIPDSYYINVLREYLYVSEDDQPMRDSAAE